MHFIFSSASLSDTQSIASFQIRNGLAFRSFSEGFARVTPPLTKPTVRIGFVRPRGERENCAPDLIQRMPVVLENEANRRKVGPGRNEMKFLSGLQPLALLILRCALSLIFIYHGYPKLVHPTDAMRDFFTSHGFPGYFLSLAGILESFGALLLFLGLFTRPAALLLAGEMAIAIWKVHSTHGILSVKDYEFPLSLAAACVVLGTIGAGSFSVDHVVLGEGRGKKRRLPKSSKE